MSAPSALFAKIYMSREMCDKWLRSPIKFIGDYGDWKDMNPAASMYEGWRDEPGCREFSPVGEFLDGIAGYARYFHCGYDEQDGAFIVADAKHGGAMNKIAASVAALRGSEKFADTSRASFIYVFPALSGGDPEALMKIEGGTSRFLFPDDTSPDTLYFVNEAEEFIESLLDEDE